MLKIYKKDYNEIDICYIGYVTIKKIVDYNNTNGVNPLYLIIKEIIGHFECSSVEEKDEIKYLVLDEIDENKEVLNKYKEVWEGIKKNLEPLIVAKTLNMGKIFKKLGLNLMMIYH